MIVVHSVSMLRLGEEMTKMNIRIVSLLRMQEAGQDDNSAADSSVIVYSHQHAHTLDVTLP